VAQGVVTSVLFNLYLNKIIAPFHHVDLVWCEDDVALVDKSNNPSLSVIYLEACLSRLKALAAGL
jgi:hypothetical protein